MGRYIRFTTEPSDAFTDPTRAYGAASLAWPPATRELAPHYSPRPERMTDPELEQESDKAKFRRTLIQVLIVQAVALALLGWLQIHYTL